MNQITIKEVTDISKLEGWTIQAATLLPGAALSFVLYHPLAEKKVRLTLTPQVTISLSQGVAIGGQRPIVADPGLLLRTEDV